MRYAAFALVSFALGFAVFVVWRTAQAMGDRDNQPADSNDVCFTVAMSTVALALGLMGTTFAVLS